MSLVDARGRAEVGRVGRGAPEPRYEVRSVREFGEVGAEIGQQLATLAPRQVAERELHAVDVLVGRHWHPFGNVIRRVPNDGVTSAVAVFQRKWNLIGMSPSRNRNPVG